MRLSGSNSRLSTERWQLGPFVTVGLFFPTGRLYSGARAAAQRGEVIRHFPLQRHPVSVE